MIFIGLSPTDFGHLSKWMIFLNKNASTPLYMSHHLCTLVLSDGGEAANYTRFSVWQHALCWFCIIFKNHMESLWKWPRFLDQEGGLHIVTTSPSIHWIGRKHVTSLKHQEGSQCWARDFEIFWEQDANWTAMMERKERNGDSISHSEVSASLPSGAQGRLTHVVTDVKAEGFLGCCEWWRNEEIHPRQWDVPGRTFHLPQNLGHRRLEEVAWVPPNTTELSPKQVVC